MKVIDPESFGQIDPERAMELLAAILPAMRSLGYSLRRVENHIYLHRADGTVAIQAHGPTEAVNRLEAIWTKTGDTVH